VGEVTCRRARGLRWWARVVGGSSVGLLLVACNATGQHRSASPPTTLTAPGGSVASSSVSTPASTPISAAPVPSAVAPSGPVVASTLRPAASTPITSAVPATSSTAAGHVPVIAPKQPGPLAYGPNGVLYISDDTLSEVLSRAPDGTFSVFAGNGTAGLSGDGGPATAAQLNQPQGLAVAANGTVYIADQTNGDVRAVSPNGTIHTVFSGGTNTDAVTTGPGAGIYIATSAGVTELHPNGELTTFATDARLDGHDPQFSPQAGCDPDALAFDPAGDLYVRCSNTNSLVERLSDGTIIFGGPFRPHDASAAITALPTGQIIGCDGDALFVLNHSTQKPLTGFDTIPGVGPFWPQGITTSPAGTIYLSQDGVSGIGPPAIISLDPQHHITVLWTAQ
jgi:hypothetical protein